LKQKDYKKRLQSLLQITQAINSNFSREQLVRIFESILKNQIGLKRFAVLSAQQGKLVPEALFGFLQSELDQIELSAYLSRLPEPGTYIRLDSDSNSPFNAVVPVFHKSKPLAYVLLADHEPVDDDDLDFIQALSNIVYVAFENKQLAREGIRQERLKKELELASQMQGQLFPDALPTGGSLEIDAFYKSHTEVGGDYYDFFPLNDHEYAICMADVSGKGVSAALLMSNFQANLQALFAYVENLETLATRLNSKVMRNARGEKFITAFLGRYNTRTRKLHFVNCGHNPPLFIHHKDLQLLKDGSIGLGMLDELPFIHKGTLDVPPESLLVCYTDGLTELQNNQGTYFGMENLCDFVMDHRQLSVKDLVVRTIVHLEKYKQNEPYRDDIAFLACRFH